MIVRRVSLALLPVAIAGALVACGSDDDASSTPTVTPAPPQAQQTGIPPLPPLANPESIPLVEQSGELYQYSISLPADWKRAPSANGYDLFNIPNPGGKDQFGNDLIAGYVSVLCRPPRPPANSPYTSTALAENEAKGINAGSGSITGGSLGSADAGSIVTIQVGQYEGATLNAQVSIGLQGRFYQVYIAEPACAWQVALNLFSPGDDTPYLALWERARTTFVPRQPVPSQ